MGILLAQIPTNSERLPPRGTNTYSSGILDKDKGFAIYGPKSTDQPNLIISDPICDKDENWIMPGYYELTLTYDRQTLILSQSGKNIVTIPVFKIEEDKSKEQTTQPMDKKSQKKADKEKKKQDKKNKKLIQQGKIPPDPNQIYNNASIEYDEQKDCYIIKYERGAIKAWGALKF